jgi:hypothetical protein
MKSDMGVLSVRRPWAELIIQGYGVTPLAKLDGDGFGFPVTKAAVLKRKSAKE